MGHIPTKLHQFLISSFLDFVRTDTQTHTRTLPKTTPARSMRAGKNYKEIFEMKTFWHTNRWSRPLLADIFVKTGLVVHT